MLEILERPTAATGRKSMTTEPMFSSTHNALTFAFNFSSEQYPESTLAKLLKRGIGSGRGLVALDGAGQAGMVLAAVGRLDPVGKGAVVARFAPRFEPCRCCGGDRAAEEWSGAIETLSAWAVPAGLSHMRLRRLIVAKFFGVSLEFKAAGEQFGVDRKKLSEHYAVIAAKLKKVEARANADLDDELRQRGVVG